MSGRNELGMLTGDLDYRDGNWPVTILSHITPVLYPCTGCGAMTLHVVGEQHAGLGIKIPFARKPLATIGKGHLLLCNNCTVVAGQLSKDSMAKLEARIIPAEICEVYDRIGDSPAPYTNGYVDAFMEHCEDLSEEARGYLRTWLSIYRREKVP